MFPTLCEVLGISKHGDRKSAVLPNCDDGLSKTVWLKHGWQEQQLPAESLYDLVFDPTEHHNLVAEESAQEVLSEMRGRLDRWMKQTDDPLLKGPVQAPHGALVNDPAGYRRKSKLRQWPVDLRATYGSFIGGAHLPRYNRGCHPGSKRFCGSRTKSLGRLGIHTGAIRNIMRRREFLTTGAAGTAALQSAANAQSRPRNVLLMIADDLGCCLPAYGDPNAVMPNIERLTREGVRFANAFCTSPSCSASRSVVLSGLYNHATGHYGHAHGEHHFSYLPEVRPYPRLLKDHGYATGYIAKLHVGPEESFGWDLANPDTTRDVWGMAQSARGFIRNAGARPWYLHCGFHDPHRAGQGFANRDYPHVTRLRLDPAKLTVPTWLPDNAETRAELVEYYEACNRFDQGVGFMLDVLRESGQERNTLVLVMSDHGAPFPNAKTNCYDAGLHVPLIVRNPDLAQRGIVNNAMTNWADIAPTVLEWTGVKPDKPLHGRSWLPVLGQTDPVGWDQIHFSHTFHEVIDYYPIRGTRTRDFKYLHNLYPGLEHPEATDLWASRTWQSMRKQGKSAMLGQRPVLQYIHRQREELYDLRNDPDEVNNLANSASHREILERLRAETIRFRKDTDDFWMKNPLPSGEGHDPAFA
ncbi:MAG TPA: sulfatase-like hydrolase/transferase [Bryobacteraceae bacterium]|nr:sulfatase-like hydrolase/transferase [Bryobacteraceae bacterium]